ncbi:MAG TPA: NmrA/HSCARG family protein [Gemmatimonadales bacterium]|nr:NmrA/HSCARG family protein [Gemmatimonadales bacterium]
MKRGSGAAKHVLVAGATGQQGGALATLLIKQGHRVRALTRNVESPRARALSAQGAELFAADAEDRASLEQAAAGIDALFAMATPFEGGVEAETRQAINIVNAAAGAGISHVVYSSVAGADQNTGIPHFESKFRVEQHLRTLGVPFTIIAPVFFMENLIAPWNIGALASGVYPMALPAGRKLQQIAVGDVAGFAAEVIARPEEFGEKRIDIASDERTGAEAAAALASASGRELKYLEIPLEQVRAGNEDLALMFDWINRVGYHADIAGLRARYPKVGWHSLEAWAAAQDWNRLFAETARVPVRREEGVDKSAGR